MPARLLPQHSDVASIGQLCGSATGVVEKEGHQVFLIALDSFVVFSFHSNDFLADQFVFDERLDGLVVDD